MTNYIIFVSIAIFSAVLKIVCLLVAIAYFTLAERKIMAAVQRRVGPNVVGFVGLLQPFADALKLVGKIGAAIPALADAVLFKLSPLVVLFVALLAGVVLPAGMSDHSENLATHVVAKILELAQTSQVVAEAAAKPEIYQRLYTLAKTAADPDADPFRIFATELEDFLVSLTTKEAQDFFGKWLSELDPSTRETFRRTMGEIQAMKMSEGEYAEEMGFEDELGEPMSKTELTNAEIDVQTRLVKEFIHQTLPPNANNKKLTQEEKDAYTFAVLHAAEIIKEWIIKNRKGPTP